MSFFHQRRWYTNALFIVAHTFRLPSVWLRKYRTHQIWQWILWIHCYIWMEEKPNYPVRVHSSASKCPFCITGYYEYHRCNYWTRGCKSIPWPGLLINLFFIQCILQMQCIFPICENPATDRNVDNDKETITNYFSLPFVFLYVYLSGAMSVALIFGPLVAVSWHCNTAIYLLDQNWN